MTRLSPSHAESLGLHEDAPAAANAVQEQAHAWLVLLTSGKASTQDGEIFRDWLAQSPQHAQAIRQARQLWDSLDPVLRQSFAPSVQDGHALMGLAQPQAQSGKPGGWQRWYSMLWPATDPWRRRAVLGGTAAAVGGWLVVRPPLQLWPAWTALTADYRTAPGEQREVALASGMSVHMNTRTALNVRSQTASDAVLALPDGEAEFRVAGGASMRVHASGAYVQADDAVFTMRCESGRAWVSCLRGSVRLVYAGGTRRIDAGRQLQYGDGALQAEVPVDVDAVAAWRSGWLTFDGQTMAQVVAEINRYRQGRLILNNAQLAQTLVQGRFSLGQLQEAETLIRDGWGASITRLGAGVVVLS